MKPSQIRAAMTSQYLIIDLQGEEIYQGDDPLMVTVHLRGAYQEMSLPGEENVSLCQGEWSDGTKCLTLDVCGPTGQQRTLCCIIGMDSPDAINACFDSPIFEQVSIQ